MNFEDGVSLIRSRFKRLFIDIVGVKRLDGNCWCCLDDAVQSGRSPELSIGVKMGLYVAKR